MNQQAMHQCPTCGFQWIRGHDGNHSCSFVLRQTVTELRVEATNRNDELELLRKLENRVRSVRGSHPSIKEGIVLDALDALREKQARA